MLPGSTTASRLQKIYEEGYLTCSTAVYYEGQGNEDEALRCWKDAVAQIRRQCVESALPDYAALTDAEKTWSDSLRALEYQAQERIDLLEVLKQSRQDDPFRDPPAGPSGTSSPASGPGSRGSPAVVSAAAGGPGGGEGWIGGGTIPAITYGELSRPQPPPPPPPPLPPRVPLDHSRTSSYERNTPSSFPAELPGDVGSGVGVSTKSNGGSSSSRNSNFGRGDTASTAEPETTAASSRSGRRLLTKRTSRSPTRERPHSLRSTLRSGNNSSHNTVSGDSPSTRSFRSSTSTRPSAERQGASKAATLAWSALGLASPSSSASSSFPKADTTRKTAETPLKSPVPSLQAQQSRRPLRDESPSSRPSLQWDSNSRRLVPQHAVPDPVPASSSSPAVAGASRSSMDWSATTPSTADVRRSGDYASQARPSSLSLNAAASALGRALQTTAITTPTTTPNAEPGWTNNNRSSSHPRPPAVTTVSASSIEKRNEPSSLQNRPKSTGPTRASAAAPNAPLATGGKVEIRRNVHPKYTTTPSTGTPSATMTTTAPPTVPRKRAGTRDKASGSSSTQQPKPSNEVAHLLADVQLEPPSSSSDDSDGRSDSRTTTAAAPAAAKNEPGTNAHLSWKKRKQALLKHLPPGVDPEAAKQILNEIVVQGDVVHWSDIAGLEAAKKALREAVVYPFLRPDLFMGLREPATGMLLFGPPGTGKTMLARAVATESRSTFFSISASSLTSKYLGESEKLVRALFALAKVLAPSIIFVDEIDSILSQRAGSGEHEATRRIKTEFLIQWSDLQRAAAGREDSNKSHTNHKSNNDNADESSHNENNYTDYPTGDANRVLVLAATNLPWAIDEAARRRFVRRQYIPLPEAETRAVQLRTLLGQQKHNLADADLAQLVQLTDGFSGSDITALAKDAAMGPLRSLGEALLMTKMDEIRPMELSDFLASLVTIRPSVSKTGLKEYEDWAREFGERGG
ncbi:aaa family ATPase [Niveomyces insectorum RCEF 264]|uniref:Aaa family ATPase n=1 Tax=Niveomyces insectorum RCEF 264 TaxID=1081102 RepID=A0A167MM12_9HYPO|nr:aaa family ATPase [Niveomyces insectorum RCEF 264]